jgi:hypothetical protein
MAGLVAGLALGTPIVEWTGAIVVVLGAIMYVGDLFDVLRRATISHRPPQAFLWAGAVWLIVGLALGMSVLAGQPWGAALLYILLVGWIGQMVNGHLHHIGVRLIATMARGDEDETQPGDLLALPLSWASFAFFQAAVAGGGMALALGVPHLLAAAALSGLSGWIVMLVNVAIATRRAKSPKAHLGRR